MVAVQKAENVTVKQAGVDFNLADKWLQFAQVSQASLKAYAKGIKRLAEYFSANGITSPTRENLLKYREYLSRRYATKTANLYITTARLFFEFLAAEGIIRVNVAAHLKTLKDSQFHKKNALSIQQVRTVNSGIDTESLKGKRDSAIFALMTVCGLRCCEITRAKVVDFEIVGDTAILRVFGKGHNSADTPIAVPNNVAVKVIEYLKARGVGMVTEPLFASCSNRNYGGELTVNSVSRVIKNYFRANGIDSKKITAHSCRHTFATVALKNGADLTQVSQMLRHKSLAVTMIYVDELNYLENQAASIASAAFGI